MIEECAAEVGASRQVCRARNEDKLGTSSASEALLKLARERHANEDRAAEVGASWLVCRARNVDKLGTGSASEALLKLARERHAN